MEAVGPRSTEHALGCGQGGRGCGARDTKPSHADQSVFPGPPFPGRRRATAVRAPTWDSPLQTCWAEPAAPRSVHSVRSKSASTCAGSLSASAPGLRRPYHPRPQMQLRARLHGRCPACGCWWSRAAGSCVSVLGQTGPSWSFRPAGAQPPPCPAALRAPRWGRGGRTAARGSWLRSHWERRARAAGNAVLGITAGLMMRYLGVRAGVWAPLGGR